MSKLRALFMGVAAMSVVCAAPLAQAAIVVNGSFENGVNDAPFGGYSTKGTGSGDITGWTVSSGTVDWINGYWQASQGTHSVDMNGTSVGALEQTINTVAGHKYLLTFDMSGNPDIGSDTRTMDVSAGATTGSYSYTFTVGPNSHGNMNWAPESLSFTATGPTTLLDFQSTSTKNCCWGPALDNVSVSAVPEPGTWAMLLVGVFGLGVVLRTSRSKQVDTAALV